MPLILISGYPSSGKTHRSQQVRAYLEAKIASSPDPRHARLSVVHIDDDSLGLERSVYATARAEKDARATLASAIKRSLGRDVIVIADAMNYIKGFRYQLYCEAKAMQTPSCVVHIGTSIDRCREINDRLLAHSSAQTASAVHTSNPTHPNTETAPVSPPSISIHPTSSGYEPSLFDNLVFRYEEPNGMTRWDSPLFTVLYEDPTLPCDEIWEAMVGSDGKAKIVKPHQATVLPAASSASDLQALERITSSILSIISAYLADHHGEVGGKVRIPDVEELVQLPTMALSLPQLQRLKRQFVAMQRSQVGKLGGVGGGVGRIPEGFVSFLNGQWGE